jgi:two-component system, OmpR family, response regulator
VNSRSLLVIDSDPAVHDLVNGLLTRDDRSIQSVFDGKDALDQLRQSAFDVVVAGQGRNGYDGLKLVRRVRAIQPAARIIVTGEQDPARVMGAIRERAFGYIHKPLSATVVRDVVTQALDSQNGQDDIHIVSARPDWLTLDVRCKIEAADRTTHFFREMMADLPSNVCEDAGAALRELLMNAVEHGGLNNPKKWARVSLIRTGRSLIFYIHDPGPGFSLDLLPHAAISNPDDAPIRHVEIRAEEGRRPGGFGILMTRNLVDELLYNERGNAVLFVKYL